MSRRGARIVARARALIGVRFRPQGRSREHGLDCIGVAVMASGIDPKWVRDNYRLRCSEEERVNGEFDFFGFVRLVPDDAEEGDLLLVRTGAAQLHIVILTDSGFLHADARLRRVVEAPGAVPWPVLSAWRCPDDGVFAVRLC